MPKSYGWETSSTQCLVIFMRCLAPPLTKTKDTISSRYVYFGLIYPKDIITEVSYVVQLQLCKLKSGYHVLLQEKILSSWESFQTSYLLFSFSFLITWTLIFNMLTKACRVIFYTFSEHCSVWLGGEFVSTSGYCLQCFPLTNSYSHCRMKDFTMFRNCFKMLPTLMISSSCATFRNFFQLLTYLQEPLHHSTTF